MGDRPWLPAADTFARPSPRGAAPGGGPALGRPTGGAHVSTGGAHVPSTSSTDASGGSHSHSSGGSRVSGVSGVGREHPRSPLGPPPRAPSHTPPGSKSTSPQQLGDTRGTDSGGSGSRRKMLTPLQTGST